MRFLSPFIPVEGDQTLETYEDPNLLAWVGVSEEFAGVMLHLVFSGAVHFHPASEAYHIKLGANPGLPVLKRLPKGRLKRPHWFPVAVSLKPFEYGRA
jgi:hypothetical protein